MKNISYNHFKYVLSLRTKFHTPSSNDTLVYISRRGDAYDSKINNNIFFLFQESTCTGTCVAPTTQVRMTAIVTLLIVGK